MRCRWACDWSIKWRYFWYWGQVYWQEQSWPWREGCLSGAEAVGSEDDGRDAEGSAALKARACGGPGPPARPRWKVTGVGPPEHKGEGCWGYWWHSGWSVGKEWSEPALLGKWAERAMESLRSEEQVLWEWWGRTRRNRSLEVTCQNYTLLYHSPQKALLLWCCCCPEGREESLSWNRAENLLHSFCLSGVLVLMTPFGGGFDMFPSRSEPCLVKKGDKVGNIIFSRNGNVDLNTKIVFLTWLTLALDSTLPRVGIVSLECIEPLKLASWRKTSFWT